VLAASRKRKTHDLREAVWKLKSSRRRWPTRPPTPAPPPAWTEPKQPLGGSPLRSVDPGYDISARTVICLTAQLEAHSVWSKLDDPKFVHVKTVGRDPPPRLTGAGELFHGCRRCGSHPRATKPIFGRSGYRAYLLLAPMADPMAAFRSRTQRILNAYRKRQVKRLAVVSRLDFERRCGDAVVMSPP